VGPFLIAENKDKVNTTNTIIYPSFHFRLLAESFTFIFTIKTKGFSGGMLVAPLEKKAFAPGRHILGQG
jgi:hypothetical protein